MNSELKVNEETRLAAVRSNNDELKKKMETLVQHYEREIELMKIKVAQLYEADIDALRNTMNNRFAAHSRERDNLLDLLRETQASLTKNVQERLNLRKEYEIRLDQYKIKYEREHQQLQDMIAMQDKHYENQTSKVSLTHIQHNNTMEDQALVRKHLESEKREL